MTRALTISMAALAVASFTTGCTTMQDLTRHHNQNPYEDQLFYQKYLNPSASPIDAAIQHDVELLRMNPNAASVHNDLGQLLLQRGFPKDAEREFERAVDADRHFYPAWYNLGLARQTRGDISGAATALHRTIRYRPGHAPALFQLGLMEEKSGNYDDAIDHMAKAFLINHQLLDVRVNPRVLDSNLVALALIKAYPNEHARESMLLQNAPMGYSDNPPQPMLSKQPDAAKIVTPTAPVTDPGKQTPPPHG